jgi:hypothetical protein
MLRKKFAIAIAAGALIGSIGLAGGAEASRCGEMPDHELVDFPTPNDSWDNPGEVTSQAIITYGVLPHQFPLPVGQTVKGLCQGAPGAP